MTSIATRARISGALYIAASAVGIIRLLYIPNTLFVRGNAAATADNIAAHEPLFRLGIVSYAVGGALWLFVPLALYWLFEGVDRTLAVLVVILGGLMQTPIYTVNTMNDAGALLLIRSESFLSVFDKPQRNALAMMLLRMHGQLDLAGMIFAGLWLFPFGLLVYRSRFLPRMLGLWLMIGCFGWLTFAIASLLVPQVQDRMFNIIQPFTFGEVVMMFWLLIVGARQPRTVESAGNP